MVCCTFGELRTLCDRVNVGVVVGVDGGGVVAIVDILKLLL